MVKVLYVVTESAVSANTDIDLPAWAPPLREIVGAVLLSPSGGSSTVLTVTTDTPSGNEIQLVDEDTIQLGTATAAGDIIIIAAVEKGEYSGA